ncbi:hypothetical protein FLA_4017 [Filimonas lacunae]|nr:hypothetical protein FLA_4017 [Filimonas lacunae]
MVEEVFIVILITIQSLLKNPDYKKIFVEFVWAVKWVLSIRFVYI